MFLKDPTDLMTNMYGDTIVTTNGKHTTHIEPNVRRKKTRAFERELSHNTSSPAASILLLFYCTATKIVTTGTIRRRYPPVNRLPSSLTPTITVRLQITKAGCNFKAVAVMATMREEEMGTAAQCSGECTL